MDSERWAGLQPPAGVRHRKKDPFQPRVLAPPDLQVRLREITELDHELDRFILRSGDYFALVADAWAANFHAATSIEGNPLSVEEVRRTTRMRMAGEGGIPLDPHHQEIVQHLLTWARPDLFARRWDTRFVREIHRLITQHQGDTYRPGAFRDDADRVQVGGPDDTVWFEGAPGVHVMDEMEELLRWLHEEAPLYHPLIAGTLFFHEFESIHPFEDGNGRVGRVLFHGYLQNNGLENAHKCMIEPALTADKDLYYRILAHTDHTGSYTELVDFFVSRTLASYRDAVDRFRSLDLLTSRVDENKKRLLIQAKRHGEWFAVAEATRWVDGRSDASVRTYLQYWESEGALESTGTTKDRRYRFKDPLKAIMEEARTAIHVSPPEEREEGREGGEGA